MTDGKELASYQRQVEQSKSELDEQHVYRLTRRRGGEQECSLLPGQKSTFREQENRSTGNQISLLPLLSKETCLYNSTVITA